MVLDNLNAGSLRGSTTQYDPAREAFVLSSHVDTGIILKRGFQWINSGWYRNSRTDSSQKGVIYFQLFQGRSSQIPFTDLQTHRDSSSPTLVSNTTQCCHSQLPGSLSCLDPTRYDSRTIPQKQHHSHYWSLGSGRGQ